ncbi:hypothetical protein M2352_000731 [Azospirillum fermentarium]|uniref:hypothetical protein n=1 Tax=Azospirillum fermentarium TaxID=1233114 RepID=UPI002227CEAA|nr:hypothetical protein [Azospirillum fermentarium]MCW2245140.1 hypothetical protein [Azospirillum fermentarium]
MLRQTRYELLRGFAYLRIIHPEIRTYTTWLPVCLTVIALFCYLALPVPPVLFGKDGTLASLLTLLSTLPGFYFAGLAAVATFGGEGMDREMPDPAPQIRIVESGRDVLIKLTRRQFLSYLFSYLVLISFIICLLIIGLNSSVDSISYVKTLISSYNYGKEMIAVGRFLIVAPLAILLSSMLVVTLHGVFFLAEKIHLP